MGAVFRDRCRTFVRPILLAALLAGAWLVAVTGPANAAAEKPNPPGAVAQAADPLLQKTVDASGPDFPGTPAPVTHKIPVPVVAVPPVSGTATTVVDAVADAPPIPGLGGTTGAVTGVVDSTAQLLADTVAATPLIGRVTDTVAGAVDGAVSAVDSLAATLPVIDVPRATGPTTPRPELPQRQVPRPERPGKAPEKASPVRSTGSVVPPFGFQSQPASLPPGAEARAQVSVAVPQPVRRAVSPLEFLANTQAVRALASSISYVVSAAPEGEFEGALRFAGLQNQAGPASTGVGSAGAEAAGDVDRFWNQLHDAGRCPVPDAALILASSPAFDPGSSPD